MKKKKKNKKNKKIKKKNKIKCRLFQLCSAFKGLNSCFKMLNGIFSAAANGKEHMPKLFYACVLSVEGLHL